MMVNKIKNKILSEEKITYGEALSLADAPIRHSIYKAEKKYLFKS